MEQPYMKQNDTTTIPENTDIDAENESIIDVTLGKFSITLSYFSFM